MDDLDKIVDGILGEPEPALTGRTYPPRVCACCGKEYVPTGPRQRLCKACGGKSARGDERVKPKTEEADLPKDSLIYEAPVPDPIADVAAAHKYLRDIAQHWNITVLDLLDHVGKLDTIARVMGNAGKD